MSTLNKKIDPFLCIRYCTDKSKKPKVQLGSTLVGRYLFLIFTLATDFNIFSVKANTQNDHYKNPNEREETHHQTKKRANSCSLEKS